MRWTTSAIVIAALSGTLAGPPAFPQDGSSSFSSGSETEDPFDLGPVHSFAWRADLGLVLAARDDAARDPAWLGDIELGVTFETFTDAGRRWGWVLAGRAERDLGVDAHGGRTGDCPAGTADCARVGSAGLPVAPIAADSGLYAAGLSGSNRLRAMVSEAYVYTDTGWGELRLGLGPGAARLDPVGGPATARLVRADGARLHAVATTTFATRSPLSGADPKLVFRSIALGQERSVGTFRASASWTPEVSQCGVDFCPRRSGEGGQVGAIQRHVGEFALTYEIRRGEHEWAASLATSQAGDVAGPAGFDPVSSLDAGLSWRWQDWRAGGRWRRSNNGAGMAGDLETWSASVGYERGDWLTTLEYAATSDDWIHHDADIWQLGTSRLVGAHGLVAFGVQAAHEASPVITPAGRRQVEAPRSAAFIELGWRY